MQEAFALDIVKKLVAEGHQALWAGGCVRDRLLGNEPHDYDVATSATPGQVRELFGRKRTLAIGASFGVIIVLPDDRSVGQVEVATFRSDSGYSDGRRPDSISFSNAEEDAKRRDFTINGMFFDPLQDEVVDYVEGQVDLELGVIRAIGDPAERIAEDKLRMLRAIRFAARFGFSIEPATADAIDQNAQTIHVVSGERIAQELRKTLSTKNPVWAMRELDRTGLLNEVLPILGKAWGSAGTRASLLLAASQSAAWLDRFVAICWAVIGADNSSREQLIDSLREKMKFANDELDAIEFALSTQAILDDALNQPWSQTQSVVVSPHVIRAESLLSARVDAAEANSHALAWLKEKRRLPLMQLDPAPILDGSDLIDLGMSPGPKFKVLLTKARAMQLDGQLEDRTAALDWLRRHASDD